MDYIPDTDEIISNLDDPWIAEQFRIRKIVHDKFIKLEEELNTECNRKLEIKPENKELIKIKNSSEAKSKRLLKKSKSSLKQENKAKKREDLSVKEKEQSVDLLVNMPSPLKHFRTPERSIQEDLEKDRNIFEVMPIDNRSFLPLSPPKMIKKKSLPNVGVFEFHHKPTRREEPKLTSHLIPGVNIKPELTIQWIPELSIPAVTRNPNNSNQLVNKMSTTESNKDYDESLCPSITKSTTSKFEEMEKLLEFDDQISVPHSDNDIKKKLRTRVREILINKYNLDLESDKSKSLSCDSDFILPSSKSILKDGDLPQNYSKSSPKNDDYSYTFEKMSKSSSPSKEESYENSNQDLRNCSLQEEENNYKYETEYTPSQKPLSTIIEVSSTISKAEKSGEDKEDIRTEHTSISPDEPTDDDTIAPSIITDSCTLTNHMQDTKNCAGKTSEGLSSKVETIYKDDSRENVSSNDNCGAMDGNVSVKYKSECDDVDANYSYSKEVSLPETNKIDIVTAILEKDIIDAIFYETQDVVKKSETIRTDNENLEVSVGTLNSTSESIFNVESAIVDINEIRNECMPISKDGDNGYPICDNNRKCVDEIENISEENIPEQITSVSIEGKVGHDDIELTSLEIDSIESFVPPSSISASVLRFPLSSGEVIPEVITCLQSEGEIYVGREQQEDSVASTRNDLSDGEQLKTHSITEDLERRSITDASVEERVMSSLSSGEWNASPNQLQRLALFADTFGFR